METRNNQTVAFTGHRKERILQGFGNDPRILAQIREAVAGMVTELYGQGYKEYYTGMASGFDMTAAEAVLQVRERYEGIKLIAAVPFGNSPCGLKRKTGCCMPVCWKGWTGWSWFPRITTRAVTCAGMNTWYVRRMLSLPIGTSYRKGEHSTR